jgi:hypothetical protein
LSWAARNELGLSPLPLVFVLGATFASYPVLFEIERGNCNVFPLLAILVIFGTLRWPRRLLGDLIAGLAVAVAIGVKPYAVALVLGLVALRRPRAALFTLAWLGVFALLLWRDVGRWLNVARETSEIQQGDYLDFSHSVISHWSVLARDLGLPWLRGLSPTLVVGGAMLGLGIGISWKVFRARDNRAVAWPYLLWLSALATFVSPVAQDYNLLFIPLAILAMWSAADSWKLHVGVATTLLWCQPLYLGISGAPWLLLKTAGVMFLGWLVVQRVSESPTVLPASVVDAAA